jgi:glycosyltransferase involved in cell wall biosynthesis
MQKVWSTVKTFRYTTMVSVIIPNYNHSSFLTERIQSVLNQTYKAFEVIILDDCSNDNSREVIESFRNRDNVSQIIYNECNSGSPFKQWQKGIELAKGKYIWIAESDDFCASNFLEVAVAKLQQSHAQVFAAKSVRVDENSKSIDEFEWWYKDLGGERWKSDYVNSCEDEIKSYLSKKCTIINTSAVVFENTPKLSSFLERITRFKSCGDWLFWLMYFADSKTIAYSTATSNYFRFHANTTRAYVPFERNFEVLKIYKWVCNNVLNGRESLNLLSYYFSLHLRFHSRKKLLQNLQFVFASFKYTSYTSWFLLRYYLQVKL